MLNKKNFSLTIKQVIKRKPSGNLEGFLLM